MVYHGQVKNGVIVLEGNSSLEEGTQVRVEPVSTNPETQTLGQRLMKFAGKIEGLPPDMARNHDHYIHGAPRKP